MNMKQFEYVLTLANCGSFSAAAEALNISQPSLSQYIKKIETQLNARLFERSGQEVTVTQAGEAYISAGEKILELERDMMGRLADLSSFKTGRLVIGTSPHRSLTLIPHAAAQFKKLYPGITPIIDERTMSEIVSDAEHGAFDFFITTLPVDTERFSYELIAEEELVLAVPPHIAAAAQTEAVAGRRYPAADIMAFDGADFIFLSENQLMRKQLDRLCADYGVTLNKAMECRTIETQLAMVNAGIGAALVPSTVDKTLFEGVKYISLRQQVPTRQLVAAYRKGQYLTEPVRCFIEILKNAGAK